jgi:CheY-like chemotaxis protein
MSGRALCWKSSRRRKSEEFNILVVEDTPEKLEQIINDVKSSRLTDLCIVVDICIATRFSEAQTQLEKWNFDAVVLDLKIPFIPSGEARLEHSKSLYEFIRDVAPYKPF